MKRIVLKISSSLIVNEGKVEKQWLKKLALLISDLKTEGYQIWLITSGAGAMYRLKKKTDVVNQSEYYIAQNFLYRLYREIFSASGLKVMEILLNKDDFQKRDKYLRIRALLESLVSNGIIPLVNEKEYINSVHKFSDNDEIAGLVASMVNSDKAIFASRVEGLLDDRDKCIDKIDFGEKFWTNYINSEVSPTGRGGMLLKCQAAEHSAQRGLDAIICSGKDIKILREIIYGNRHGTLFVADKRKRAKKRWIFDNKDFYNGQILVDEGLSSVIRAGKPASILSVGVSSIIGDFSPREVVTIKDGSRVLGYGEIRYGSKYARSLIDDKISKILIHYDDYVRTV